MQCDQPRKPRPPSSSGFYTLCEEHFKAWKKAYMRARYLRKKEDLLAWHKAHRQTEARKRYQRDKAREYYVENKEDAIQRGQEYRERHPEETRAKSRRERQRRNGAAGFCTEEQWQARVDLFGRRCYLCGCDWDALPGKKQTVEHVIPLSEGGTNWPANLRPACGYCNSSKGAKGMKPWRRFLRSRFAPWSRMVDGYAVV
jgi:5-methylcytosine-specific restriction endonuclease McrA